MNEPFKKSLAEAGRRLGACKIAYAVAGNANLVLHGLDVETKSVTIVVNEKDLANIKDAFFEYEVSGVKKVKEKSVVSFLLDGTQVEVFSDKVYTGILKNGQVEPVAFMDENIVGVTLDAQKDIFEKLGDEENAKLVEEYLS